MTSMFHACFIVTMTFDIAERLNVDQLKQLCKAAKLRHVGKKQELVDRLLDSPIACKYGPEGKYVSLNIDAIKGSGRSAAFQVAGREAWQVSEKMFRMTKMYAVSVQRLNLRARQTMVTRRRFARMCARRLRDYRVQGR